MDEKPKSTKGRKGNLKPFDVMKRRETAAAYYLQGYPQYWIAQKLKMSPQQISVDLKIVRNQWMDRAVESIDKRKSEELAKLDRVELEAWQAWDRSQRQRTEKMEKDIQGGRDGSRTENSTRKIKYIGDPRFLEVVERCIERRCKIIGIDAPQKIDAHLTGSLSIAEQEIESMDDAALRAFIEQEEARQRDVGEWSEN